MRCTARVSRLALLVAILLAGLCLGDLAQAAMPMGPDCPGGRCDEQIACRQPVPFHSQTGPSAPHAAIPPSTDLQLGPSPSGLVAVVPGVEDPPGRRAAPLASRSPPAA